jgi:hypothetical protein
MTLLGGVIASEAKQSRAARDCFGGLRPPRNDAVGRDCFVARKSGLPDLRIILADLG